MAENGANGVPATTGGGEGGEQGAAPAPQRSWMDIARSIMFQMVIFYFISSYFRGSKTPPPPPQGPDGKPLEMAGMNLFSKGQELVSEGNQSVPSTRKGEGENVGSPYWALTHPGTNWGLHADSQLMSQHRTGPQLMSQHRTGPQLMSQHRTGPQLMSQHRNMLQSTIWGLHNNYPTCGS